MPKMRPASERFNEKVDRSAGPDACWHWTGHRLPFGHGTFSPGRRSGNRHGYAHRFAWEQANGPIPEGLHVLHKCDNPPCVNPAHLFVGTHQDNMRDMVAKKREGRGETLPQAKLTEQSVREMRQRHADGETCVDLAKEYGVTHMTASRALRRISWTHV